MSNIGLIDVDGHNFPNFALMKIAAYHKSKDDKVEWANRRWTFKTCDFNDFQPRNGFLCSSYFNNKE